MNTFTSLARFSEYRKRVLEAADGGAPCLVVSAGTCGMASGASDIIRVVKRLFIEQNLQEQLSLRITGCQGFCQLEPFILVLPTGRMYPRLKMEDVPRIVAAEAEGRAAEELLYRDPVTGAVCATQDEIPFFKGQRRTIVGQSQFIDPIRVVDYLATGGYAALEKALERNDPDWIIEQVKASGLRGRGGAGFRTGLKWELARKAKSADGVKYVVCNADEGDPGAYMDRSVLEGNPHTVIEGMTIAGLAIGATKGVIYVRTEYPLAIKHTMIALRQARELGLLGADILGTGHSFDIEIVRGAGAFVCGEETALMRSVEGYMGEPRQRPPFPIQKGIHGRPTSINNVETFANVPVIIREGAEAYAKVGVPGSSGTKIFSLVGKIRNTGLVEVPLGTKLRDVVYPIGGGPSGHAKIKAVQTGGPSGGCIPASMFDLSIDYESLAKVGSIMGSGGMIVMDEQTCMVDVAKYFMSFLRDESCGKCFTCRKGTQRMHELLDDISKGTATLETLDLLEELALTVKDSTMCGLGQSAPNPVLSTLRYYRDEYIEHIVHKRCPAGVCRDLVGASCAAACPLGTEVWRYVAHIERGEYEDAYRVIRATNPLPSVCARVCNHPCEHACKMGTTGASPVSIRALKRFVTDTVDPAACQGQRAAVAPEGAKQVAVVGAGPAGLSAAHNLSRLGYRVTLFEAEQAPGGMLRAGIPSYRLPREVLDREIKELIDPNVTLECGKRIGADFTVDSLLEGGRFDAVYLALGAHESRTLGLEGEDVEGVVPAMKFLRAFNLEGKGLAEGRVGIIGGGNSAVDAARVAIRLPGVTQVTIFYRRTRDEMPAYEEEIEAALAEGIELKTLLTPTKLVSKRGKLVGLECVTNRLGDYGDDGRRRPVAVPGTEQVFALDTLIAAIGEVPATAELGLTGAAIDRSGCVVADGHTYATARPGVFAGGDVQTGPNTVVEALASGLRVATMIDRYLKGEPLVQPGRVRLPAAYVEGSPLKDSLPAGAKRAVAPVVDAAQAKAGFVEVELCLSEDAARLEARRCLRCDLEFTRPATQSPAAPKGEVA